MQLIEPLTRQEFTHSIANGLGRAKLHVIQHGIINVADLLLDACLQNQAYDPQIEASRASWLFAMFQNSNRYEVFKDAILNKLKHEQCDSWTLQQLCQLAKEMAASGDLIAHKTLGDRVKEIANLKTSDDWIGAEEWIELEGDSGVLGLARIYGQRLLNDPNDFVPDFFLYVENNQHVESLLKAHAQGDPQITAYKDYLLQQKRPWGKTAVSNKESRIQKFRKRFREKNPLEKIINDAQNGVAQFPGQYMRFGTFATPEELETIFANLISETKESTIVRYLWVFRRAPLPRLHPKILSWAKEANAALQAASIASLSNFSNSKVHQLAREKVAKLEVKEANSESLRLFLHNYESQDSNLIFHALLKVKANRDEAHELGTDILDLAQAHNDEALGKVLRWVYEHTPCSICRLKAIKYLKQFNQLPQSIIEECRYDRDFEIRKYANGLLS